MRRSTAGWWRRRKLLVGLALVTALAASAGSAGISSAGAAATSTSAASPVSKALDYVVSCQRSDGGFAEKGASASSESLTAWTILAISSTGQDPNAWKVNGKSPVDYLKVTPRDVNSVPVCARTALAVHAAKHDPRSFGGVNLIKNIRDQEHDHGSAGDSFGPDVNSHIWALIGLKAAGETVTSREVSWLLSQQNADGGWGATAGAPSNTTDSGAALQALAACGQSRESDGVKQGIEYLRARWASDSNSSSWAIQALYASGQDPGGSAWKRGSATPVSALVSLQRTGGSIGTANPLLATVQAIPALSAKPFPLATPGSSSAAFRGAPVVTLVTPGVGSTVPASGSMVLKLSLTDAGTGIDSTTLNVKVDGKSAKAKLSGTTVSIGPVSMSKGSHSVAVSVADHAGNAVTSQKFSFTVSAASASSASAASAASAGSYSAAASVSGTQTAQFRFPGPTSNDPSVSAATTTEPEATSTVNLARLDEPKNESEKQKEKPSPIIPLAIGATSALAVVTSGTWVFVARRRKKSRPAS